MSTDTDRAAKIAAFLALPKSERAALRSAPKSAELRASDQQKRVRQRRHIVTHRDIQTIKRAQKGLRIWAR